MGAMSFVSEDIKAHVNIDITLLEIHNLAYFYHWGRRECWELPCTERGVFNDQIRKQIKAENGNDSGSPKDLNSYRESM